MLERIPVPMGTDPIPRAVRRFVADADERIENFIRARLERPMTGFVPSDFIQVYRGLREIVRRDLAPGRMFCEWGSGFGVVAGLAAMLDFDVVAIEIEPELADASAALLADHDLNVEVACGSFLPRGSEHAADHVDGPEWLVTWAPDAYGDLELDVEDFDVVFAYPWPGEEGVLEDIFEAYAAVGSLFLTYRGLEEIHVQRKGGARRR
ncbi:MAG: hypothetical protein R3F20_13040 [Planctomycetota bacterium]